MNVWCNNLKFRNYIWTAFGWFSTATLFCQLYPLESIIFNHISLDNTNALYYHFSKGILYSKSENMIRLDQIFLKFWYVVYIYENTYNSFVHLGSYVLNTQRSMCSIIYPYKIYLSSFLYQSANTFKLVSYVVAPMHPRDAWFTTFDEHAVKIPLSSDSILHCYWWRSLYLPPPYEPLAASSWAKPSFRSPDIWFLS